MSKKRVVRLWAGLMDDKFHFYRNEEYYRGVPHADLFRTKADARQCYEKVVRVTVERLPRKRRKAT